MRNSINICYITDSRFALPTATSLLSLIKTTLEPLSIYIVTDNIDNNIVKYYKSLSNENINIQVINKEIDYQDLIKSHPHVSKTALLKFELPEILKDIDKVLYIDGDTLIYEDLKELYEIDISKNYIAAVSDFAGLIEGHHERLRHKNYFNSGVMLLNLNKMRINNITEQLIDYKRNKCVNHFMDQDAFNAVLYEKTLFLHPKFNFMLPNLKNCDKEKFALNYGITRDETLDLFEGKYSILHITNKCKPWNFVKSDLFSIWYEYFKEINLVELKQEFYDNFVQNAINSIQEIKTTLDNKLPTLCEEMEAMRNDIFKLTQKKSFAEKIFSIKNERKNNIKHKVITIFGIKMKFRSKSKNES